MNLALSGKLRKMTLKISEIEKLSLNPYWLSNIICHFIEGYGNKAPFELVYLAIPLILRGEPRNGLCKLNTTSTIYSAFLDDKDKRKRITALQYYVEVYKEFVNPAFIVYANKGNDFGIKLTNKNIYDYKKERDKTTRNYLKAAHNLGNVFSKEKTQDCFFKLGVFKL